MICFTRFPFLLLRWQQVPVEQLLKRPKKHKIISVLPVKNEVNRAWWIGWTSKNQDLIEMTMNKTRNPDPLSLTKGVFLSIFQHISLVVSYVMLFEPFCSSALLLPRLIRHMENEQIQQMVQLVSFIHTDRYLYKRHKV